MDATLITAIGSITVALVTTFGGWMLGRRKASAEATALLERSSSEVQGSIHKGFEMLLQQHRTDRAEWQIERKSLLEEIGGLRLDVRRLSRRVGSLEKTIRDAALPMPPEET